MLTIYRRPRKKCPNADDRYYKRCKCALWAEGTIEGKYIRQSLKTRSRERAIETVRNTKTGKVEAKPDTTLKTAVERYLADASVSKLTLPLKCFQAFCDGKNLTLQAIAIDHLREFR